MRRRLAAAAALLLGAAALAAIVVLGIEDFPRGLVTVGCAALAVPAGWKGLTRHGPVRTAGIAAAALLLAGSLVLIAAGGRALEGALVVTALAIAVSAARVAFAVPARLPLAPRPSKPMLFMNPRSGGGKAERFNLAEEARERGIEPVDLKPGDDLKALVEDGIARGADALAMAGGDGSQAIVAAIAADHGLPYACIPAGTRNHFALDLGVDRNDVVGALDAFVDGRERRVDLAEVNGRVFVNNVSLGFYAEAVQRPEYRDAKLHTILETLRSEDSEALDLRWSPPDGEEPWPAAAILVSNNRYRIGRAIGSGTRPHLDRGVLGIAVLEAANSRGNGPRRRPWRDWTVRRFEVGCDHPVKAGIDGEAAVIDAPLTFTIRRRALRARIARRHPGASPSAAVPDTAWQSTRALVRIALGRPARQPAERSHAA